jgi:hypothetical protein
MTAAQTTTTETMMSEHQADPARLTDSETGTAIGSALPSSLTTPGGPQAQGWEPIETLIDADQEAIMWTPRERLYTAEQLRAFPDLSGEQRVSTRRHWTWSTHWMPLPLPPVPSRDEEKGKE